MGFLRNVLAGKFPVGVHRRRSEAEHEQEKDAEGPEGEIGAVRRHALDSLPRLPPRRRPITPVPAEPQWRQDQDRPCHFFRLPPEIRLQIYRLVLAGREIHIDMRYTAADTTTPHS
ncbi:hypothetical protein VTH06DRAFT_3194, partial [Thermothelomyces fergusii]